MKNKIFEQELKLMSDQVLINSVENQINDLSKTKGRSYIMSIPDKIIGTDMIFYELLRRYKESCLKTTNLLTLRQWRKMKGFTQTEMGRKVGLTLQQISNIETGRNKPYQRTKDRIEKFTKEPIDWNITYINGNCIF